MSERHKTDKFISSTIAVETPCYTVKYYVPTYLLHKTSSIDKKLSQMMKNNFAK